MFSTGTRSARSTSRHALRAVAALTAAGLLIGGMTACSSPGPHDPAAAVVASRAITVTSHPTTLSFVATDIDGNNVTIDLGEKDKGAPGIGDLVAFTQDLASRGVKVGQVHVIAAVVDDTRHLSEATATITLKNGSIQLAGMVAMDPTFTLAVTGGTGDYVGATGTMDFDASGDAQTITVHLR